MTNTGYAITECIRYMRCGIIQTACRHCKQVLANTNKSMLFNHTFCQMGSAICTVTYGPCYHVHSVSMRLAHGFCVQSSWSKQQQINQNHKPSHKAITGTHLSQSQSVDLPYNCVYLGILVDETQSKVLIYAWQTFVAVAVLTDVKHFRQGGHFVVTWLTLSVLHTLSNSLFIHIVGHFTLSVLHFIQFCTTTSHPDFPNYLFTLGILQITIVLKA